PILAGEELDVVDQQHVDRPIAGPEVDHPAFLDGRDHLVHEFFAGHVSDPPAVMLLQHGMTDGMHQVRLAETDATVEEQRVVRFRRRFCYGAAGRMGKAGVVAHHEMLELKFRIELRSLGQHRLFFLGRWLLRHGDGRPAAQRLRLAGDDFKGHADVAGNDRRQGFLDHRGVAVLQPVFGQLRRHADFEVILFAPDERRILQPGLVTRLTELEAKFFLRRLPDLLWVHTLLHTYTYDRLVAEQT